MNLINWAHGELIMIGGYVMYFLSSQPAWIVVVGTLAAVVIAALAMERIAFRPVRMADATTLMVTSFALSFFLQNGVYATIGAIPRAFGAFPSLVEPIDVFGLQVPLVSVVTIVVTLILLAGLVTFLRQTALGNQMRAAAEDFSTARLMGVKANRVIATAFAISGFLAATVALLFVAQTGQVSATMGVEPVIVAFVSVVIGGMGNLIGAALGGFIVGCLTVVLQATLPVDVADYRQAIVFGVVIGFLLFRPGGLLPSRMVGRRV